MQAINKYMNGNLLICEVGRLDVDLVTPNNNGYPQKDSHCC
jgi:hypothetical protein